MYIISEKILKIKKSEIIYFVLSLCFIVFSFVSIGIFKTLGSYLSFFGEGKFLFTGLLLILCSLLFLVAQRKYKITTLLYFSYSMAVIAIPIIFQHFNIDFSYTICFITLLSIYLSLSKTNENIYKETLFKFSRILLYVLMFTMFNYAVSLTSNSDINISTKILVIVTSLLLIGYTFLQAITKEFKFNKIILPIIFLTFATIVTDLLQIGKITELIILSSLSFVTIIFSYYKREDKTLSLATSIVGNLFLLLFYYISYYLDVIYFPIILSSVWLVINILITKTKDTLPSLNFEIYTQPIKIFLLSSSIFTVLQNNFNIFNAYDFYIITSVLLLITYFFQKNVKLKLAYFISTIVLSVVFFINNIYEINIWFKLVNIVIFGVLMLITYKNTDDKYKSCRTLLTLLTTVCIFTTTDFIATRYNYLLINNILLITIFTLIALFKKDNKSIVINSLIGIVLSYYSLTLFLNLTLNLKIILNSLPMFIILFVCTRKVFENKNPKTQNTLEIISISLIYLFTIFNPNIYIGLYIGILGFISIIIGIKSSKYYSLFYTGIIVTIVNVIYHIYHLWNEIPFPIYLLITGVGLIGFVTFRELKSKNKNSQKRETIIQERISSSDTQKIILILFVFFSIFMFLNIYVNNKNNVINTQEVKQNEEMTVQKITELLPDLDYDKVSFNVQEYSINNKKDMNVQIILEKYYNPDINKIVKTITQDLDIKNNNISIIRVDKLNGENEIILFEYYYEEISPNNIKLGKFVFNDDLNYFDVIEKTDSFIVNFDPYEKEIFETKFILDENHSEKTLSCRFVYSSKSPEVTTEDNKNYVIKASDTFRCSVGDKITSTYNIDFKNDILVRNGKLGDNVYWIVNQNGYELYKFSAVHTLEYDMAYDLYESGEYEIYLATIENNKEIRVSNIIYHNVGNY